MKGPLVALLIPPSEGLLSALEPWLGVAEPSRTRCSDKTLSHPRSGKSSSDPGYGFEDLPVGEAAVITTPWGRIETWDAGGIGESASSLLRGRYAYTREGMVMFFNKPVTRVTFQYENTGDGLARVDFFQGQNFLEPRSAGRVTMDYPNGYTYILFTHFQDGELRVDDLVTEPSL